MKVKLIFFCTLLCIWYGSFAQEDKPFGFVPLEKYYHTVNVPFELKSNLIIIKVVVDKSDTLNFVLDSGVQGIIILDTTLFRTLDAKPSRKLIIKGLGSAPPINAYVSIGHTVKIGRIINHYQNLVFLDQTYLNLSEHIGLPIHGIIGSDLFQRFNITIDYGHHNLVFSNPDRYKYKKKKGILLDLHLDRTKPYVTVNEVNSNGTKLKNLALVIDTGGSHALMLNKESLPESIVPEKLVEGNLGSGLNGKIEGKLGRVNSLSFANQEFFDIITTFPDTLLIENKTIIDEVLRQGSIGGEILKRFVVTLNYKQKIIVLKPIKKEIIKPFESDMSGLDLRAVGLDFKSFEVASITPNSVSDQAGLKEGDLIITFNKRMAKNLSIGDFYKELTKREGHLIELIVMRDRQLEQISFRLKRLI